jgi:hypothetical protein
VDILIVARTQCGPKAILSVAFALHARGRARSSVRRTPFSKVQQSSQPPVRLKSTRKQAMRKKTGVVSSRGAFRRACIQSRALPAAGRLALACPLHVGGKPLLRPVLLFNTISLMRSVDIHARRLSSREGATLKLDRIASASCSLIGDGQSMNS